MPDPTCKTKCRVPFSADSNTVNERPLNTVRPIRLIRLHCETSSFIFLNSFLVSLLHVLGCPSLSGARNTWTVSSSPLLTMYFNFKRFAGIFGWCGSFLMAVKYLFPAYGNQYQNTTKWFRICNGGTFEFGFLHYFNFWGSVKSGLSNSKIFIFKKYNPKIPWGHKRPDQRYPILELIGGANTIPAKNRNLYFRLSRNSLRKIKIKRMYIRTRTGANSSNEIYLLRTQALILIFGKGFFDNLCLIDFGVFSWKNRVHQH